MALLLTKHGIAKMPSNRNTQGMNQSGFSIIELLITLVIVGVLSSLAYPQYRNTVSQIRRKQAQWQLQHWANEWRHAQLHHPQSAQTSLKTPKVNGYHFTQSTTSTGAIVLTATPRSPHAQGEPAQTLTITLSHAHHSAAHD